MIRHALAALAAAVVLATGPGRLLWRLARDRDAAALRPRAARERTQPVPPGSAHRSGDAW